jgi:hypothetical protein
MAEEIGFDKRASEMTQNVLIAQGQGFAVVMEWGRLGTLEGKMGMRESLAHRAVTEGGSGRTRQLDDGTGADSN